MSPAKTSAASEVSASSGQPARIVDLGDPPKRAYIFPPVKDQALACEELDPHMVPWMGV